MDFTREPIIETVITPREGYRLVVRSSKGAGSEEHFVDALEVVSFGSSVFFRCMERPKPFIVPVADYEVLEVREPRMVLKTPSEQSQKAQTQKLKIEPQKVEKVEAVAASSEAQAPVAGQPQEARADRGGRRDRRRGFRRRRGQGRDEAGREEGAAQAPNGQEMREESDVLPAVEGFAEEESKVLSSTPMLATILPPPTKLIRDDLERLRKDYTGAFYIDDEEKDLRDDDEEASLAGLGTPSEEELAFREAPYEISDEDIRMSEGGDMEVSQEDPFCPPSMEQKANSGSSQDVQKDLG